MSATVGLHIAIALISYISGHYRMLTGSGESITATRLIAYNRASSSAFLMANSSSFRIPASRSDASFVS